MEGAMIRTIPVRAYIARRATKVISIMIQKLIFVPQHMAFTMTAVGPFSDVGSTRFEFFDFFAFRAFRIRHIYYVYFFGR
jgi:hypothetical protein